MEQTNRAIVQRTWGLHAVAASASAVSSASTSTSADDPGVGDVVDDAKRLAYGDQFQYEEKFVLPVRGRIPALLYSIGMVVGLAVLTVVTPVRICQMAAGGGGNRVSMVLVFIVGRC